jgi:hypothetical protein
LPIFDGVRSGHIGCSESIPHHYLLDGRIRATVGCGWCLKNVLQLGLLSLLDLAAFFSPALRFKRLVFAHTHLLHKESLPTDFDGHFPPPSYSLEPRALFTCAHGISIAL